MLYPVRIDRRVFVEMDDGVRLALTVYLPDSELDGPFPTVVESIPYRKDDAFYAPDWSTYAYLAARGFAGVRIDIRGTGASTGIIEDEYTPREQADTLAVFDWLEEQDWCDGNLGMWGVSWGGFSALQTAMLRPPQLKAIAPVHATHDRFACDVHYTGGSLHAQEQVDWPPSMVLCNALPPDPDLVGETWFEEWMERLDRTPQWPGIWLRHQKRDDYWGHGSPSSDYAAITCPTLLIGGWVDGYVDGMLALAEDLTCPRRTIIGPWGHYRPATGCPGPTLDHLDLLARWFGHHLRGDDNGVMDLPPLTIYVRTGVPFDGPATPPFDLPTPGYWRAEQAWPPPDAAMTEMVVTPGLGTEEHSNGSQPRQAGSGVPRLSWSGPQWVGRHAPAWDRAGIGSSDSTPDDEHSISFVTSPLSEPIELLGTPEVEATVASTHSVGLIAARLSAVDPDGTGHLVTRGSRNLVFPEDLSDPVAVVPGRGRSIRFPLMATSAVVPKGWRLRLALAGADFPVVWPPGRRFELTLDPDRLRLILPIVSRQSDVGRLEIPPAPNPPAPPGVVDEESSRAWTDRTEGKTTHRRHRAARQHIPDRADLTYASEEAWSVSVEDDDPASTRVHSDGQMSLSRPGWEVSTRASFDLSADEETFHLVIELSAFQGDEEVFARRWEEHVLRHWS